MPVSTSSGTTWTTVLGDISFDAVGDTSQKIISLYKVDMTAKDWVFEFQLNYGQGTCYACPHGYYCPGKPGGSWPATFSDAVQMQKCA